MSRVAAFFLLIALCPVAAAQDARAAAQALFAEYQKRGNAFDPGLADLYCDSAVVRSTRIYPDGNRRLLEIPAARYEELVRTAMPLARARNDHSTYSRITYAREGANVRISATRYSELKRYSSPFSLLVGQCGGRWGVLEEVTETRP